MRTLSETSAAYLAAVAVTAALAGAPCSASHAQPDPPPCQATAMPASITGASPNQLGTWSVDYDRIGAPSGDVTDTINDALDAEAETAVRQVSWDATKDRPWTFHSRGTLTAGRITISELYLGEYDTDLPNMPVHTVSTRVLDCRTGMPVTWDNLFTDKTAGLTRLAQQATGLLPAQYRLPGNWNYGGEMDPLDINFRFWIPTPDGIALYFPDYQVDRTAKTITVGWSRIADLLAPPYIAITHPSL